MKKNSGRLRLRTHFKIILLLLFVTLITATHSEQESIKFESVLFNRVLGFNAYKVEEKKEEPKVEQNISQNNENTTTKPKKTVKKLTGSLTGYAADCPQCSGRLACSSYNVYKNNVVTYPDKEYGNVRIVASSKNLPCGSIIRFRKSSISNGDIYAVVLDRGVRGNNIDLLVESESIAYKSVGRSNISYEILRSGW